MALDAVALAKGICRCVDASRAIEDKLGSITTIEVDQNKDSMIEGDQTPPNVRQLERDLLLSLGPSLGRSAESLLVLALLHMRSLSHNVASAGGNMGLRVTRKNIDELAEALMPALEYTQVEQMGVGCILLSALTDGKEATKDFSRETARTLREQLLSLA
eukprot:CAMPEP_0195527484 /NCGR_PEP_ID=MMETSP0794_2-20130614/29192_1 /TAXON_ID=515487 /ORGANISM="Stephanopyxis turris, Strain CCMP 815" /LENGTH=159 /DNA_ID=CAMNT_0040658391 /DNA_START=96 /DNA_END=575 /DNA_ORIENTATION=-